MAEGVGCVVDSENGSFHSQITQRLPRKATQAAISAWKPLCARKSPTGRPASWEKRSIQPVAWWLFIGWGGTFIFWRPPPPPPPPPGSYARRIVITHDTVNKPRRGGQLPPPPPWPPRHCIQRASKFLCE